MSGFKNMLTFDRVKGFIKQGILPSFTAEELWQVWDWLDDLSIEVELMKQSIQKARGVRTDVFTSKPAHDPTTTAPDAAGEIYEEYLPDCPTCRETGRGLRIPLRR